MFSLLTSLLSAATINEAETWATDTAGWKGVDTLGGAAKAVSVAEGALRLSFPAQTISLPARYRMFADAGGSGGRFVGDYAAAGVQAARFRLRCVTHLPQQARLQFYNAQTGRMWWHDLTGLKVGEWVSFNVPMVYGEWWRLGTTPDATKFAEDLASVDWIGIRIMKNGDIAAQTYELDDFEVSGETAVSPVPDTWVTDYFGTNTANTVAFAAADSDGDDSSNYGEYLAGTDPTDPSSVFELLIESDESKSAGGVVLKWRSISNRWYTVERATDLTQGFAELELNIPATPPVNTYRDASATDKGPYFYRISVRE